MAYSLQELEQKFVNAHNAGDKEAAAALAALVKERRQAEKAAAVKATMPGFSMSGAELGARGIKAGLEDFGIGTAQLLSKAIPGDSLDNYLAQLEADKRAEREGILTGRPDLGIPSPTDAYTSDLGIVDYNPIGFGRGSAAALAGLLTGKAGGAVLEPVLGATSRLPAVTRAAANLEAFSEASPTLAAIGRGVRSVAGGAASGAAGGASIPLTAEEEAAGARLENAITGADIGAAVPVIAGTVVGLKRGYNFANRQTPDEASKELAARLGYRVGGDVVDPQIDFRRAVEQGYSDAREGTSAAYNIVERVLPGAKTPVNLSGPVGSDLLKSLQVLDKKFDLSGRVDEGTRNTIRELKGVSYQDAMAGRESPQISFRDLREMQREVRSVLRDIQPDNPWYGYAARAQSALQEIQDDWARQSPATADALAQSKDVDRLYATKAKPFEEGRLGDIRNAKEADLYTARNALEDPSSGFSYYSPEAENVLTRTSGLPLAREIIDRVPEAADPLRRVWARNLVNAGGTGASRAEMLSGGGALRTLGVDDTDVLTQAERLAQAYRGQDESPALSWMAKKIPLAERLLSGVPRIGEYPELLRQPDATSRIAAWLLSGPAVQSQE